MKTNATILTIGDELLIGQIIDTNSAWIGQKLSDIGIPIHERIAVGDSDEDIRSGLERSVSTSDIIIITGGLGPTKDDITKHSLAAFLDVELEFHSETYERIVKLFNARNIDITPSHKQQCYLPKGCIILENRMGTAPGMLMKYHDKVLISMPGVPFEMKAIMNDHVLEYLQKNYITDTIIHRTIKTASMGETSIADLIIDIEESLPTYIKLAYLPEIGGVKLRLSGVSKNKDSLDDELERYVQAITDMVGINVYGYDLETLEEALGILCIKQGIKIGTAESCTGGNIARKIVGVPGSSRYFEGGVVSYSNGLKEKLLGVDPNTISTYGAVSEETVKEMAEGAIKLLNVDYSVSISGIAGPSGGSEEKPVGLSYIACSNGKKTETYKILSGKDREKNIIFSTSMALNLLRKFIIKSI